MASFIYGLRDVEVRYGDRTVLDIDELNLQGGQVVTIVGANGAGKSTLLRLLAFLVVPTCGVVELDGHPVAYGRGLTDLRRRVTYVAQSPILFRRSVEANVAYGLRARNQPVETRATDALRAVGMESFAARAAWRLSGGEIQRVAIARAIACDPEVYLFDEPTSNIDRENVPVIEALLERLSAAGKSVVLTTHDIDQAYRLGTQVVVLDAGKLAPAPVLNVFRGEVRESAGNAYLDCSGLRIELPHGLRARTVAIDANDIIVSRARIDSSARNSFPGTIAGVETDRRGIVLAVDCGQILRARITPHSYEEMALGVGSPVYLTFKSSAIRPFRWQGSVSNRPPTPDP